jgi:hypothetical protein
MSIDNLHDDAEFERFLAGEGELSLQLKGLPQAEPSGELDAAVFASIEAAMAAEKVQVVEPTPGGAANDPVGPASGSPQKKRSMAWYWHWPVGVAAGILLTVAYRTGFEPSRPASSTVALADQPLESGLIAPPPPLAAPAAKVAVSPPPIHAVGEPPVIPPPAVAEVPENAPVTTASAAPSIAPSAAPRLARMAPAPEAGQAKLDSRQLQTVVVTGANIRRADAETASPIQVITASDLARRDGTRTQFEGDGESGVAKAWGYDPAQAARSARAQPSAPLLASAPAAASPAPVPLPVPAKPELALRDSPVEAVQLTGGGEKGEPATPVAAAIPPPAGAVAPAAAAPAGDLGALRRAPTASIAIDSPKPDVLAVAPMADARTIVVQSAPSSSYGITDKAAAQASPPVSEQDFLRKKSTDDAHSDPAKWLAMIKLKIKQKDNLAALAEWDKFCLAYPAYPVADKYRARINALRAKIQPAASATQTPP